MHGTHNVCMYTWQLYSSTYMYIHTMVHTGTRVSFNSIVQACCIRVGWLVGRCIKWIVAARCALACLIGWLIVRVTMHARFCFWLATIVIVSGV